MSGANSQWGRVCSEWGQVCGWKGALGTSAPHYVPWNSYRFLHFPLSFASRSFFQPKKEDKGKKPEKEVTQETESPSRYLMRQG